jgi:cellulose synthase/poly-beta-1,6-N-acetylglucosamine synthase-like glycosyltransferase
MVLSLFLTCLVALVIATVLLLAVGARVRVASRLLGAVLIVAVTAIAGEAAARIWSLPSEYVEYGQAVILAWGLVVVVVRKVWNPIGQLFFATFLSSAFAYLAFAVDTTFGDGLSFIARVASFVLLLFEIAALLLAGSFTFESCDSVCRVRASRRIPKRDPNHLPKVSIHIGAYNEPPDMLIQTIQSIEALDYPDFEVVIVDNNTKDPAVWQPVEEYCRDRPRLKFVHVDPWPGYKSGALNLALREYTDPAAEVIGIVDADYLLDPNWLRELVGFFAEPSVGFVQSPQDYREYQDDAYLESCYDAYEYFFATTMPSRNQRDSIIFAGTMGLLRRSAVEEVGGWDEWCITEDAELSLRMLRAGYEGVYVRRSYGRGIMPLTFSALKSQRFRWCFGGMQILRMHWHDLTPWNRDPSNQLTLAQRTDYLIGNLQWTNDLVYFGFTLALLASAVVLAGHGPAGLRPLYGAAVLLPLALILSGLVRALWALRARTGITIKRAVLAFSNWLSLSWTVAIACVQGLTRSEGVFLRTPKTGDRHGLITALWSARTETFWALALWAAAAVAIVNDRARPFVIGLFLWQGLVYASAPFMSWLNQHTELSAQLERRQRTERLRERAVRAAPISLGMLAAAGAGVVIALLIGFGGSNPGHPSNPFATPERAPGDGGPLSHIVSGTPDQPPSTTTAPNTMLPPQTTTPAGSDSTPDTTAPPETSPATSPPTTASPTTTPPTTAAPVS